MGDISPHFSRSEFRDRRTGHLIGPQRELLVVLENIRNLAGRPVYIISGHRCPATNAAVGGARQSRHLGGDAADIAPELVTVAQAEWCGAVGIGSSGGWAVHVDCRPGPAVRWKSR